MLAQAIASDERFTARLAGDFAGRCIELARQNHLDGTARLERIGTRTLAFTVPSRLRNREYSVIADFAGTVWCEQCPASKRHHPCSHAGAVYHALRQLAQACKEYAAPEPAPAASVPRKALRTLGLAEASEYDAWQSERDRIQSAIYDTYTEAELADQAATERWQSIRSAEDY
jgi:hypothetical protein